MIAILYGIVIITATFLGAFAGLGGGIIIKPVLDLIGKDTVDVVNFISSCAVFSMSISSTIKHIRVKTDYNFKFLITLSAGAVAGGICGSMLFDALLARFDNAKLKALQGIILGTILLASVVYINLKKAKTFDIKSPLGIIIAGLVLGFTASFLGVGGGPVNVAFLVLLFSMTMKEAAVYSVGIIFFSQLSKLTAMGIIGSIPHINPGTIAVAVACAVAGGILGATMNKKGSEKSIRITFTIIVATLVLVNYYNAFTIFN